MKFLIDYNFFISEQNVDDPNINLKRSTSLNYDKMILEYNSKKSAISALFENPDVTQGDIDKQLKTYTTNKGVFKNELLKMWWDLCSLSFQVKNKEKKISDVQKNIDTQKSELNTNDADVKTKTQQIVSNMENISKNYENDIKLLKEKILKLGKEMNLKLKEYKTKSRNIKIELEQNKS